MIRTHHRDLWAPEVLQLHPSPIVRLSQSCRAVRLPEQLNLFCSPAFGDKHRAVRLYKGCRRRTAVPSTMLVVRREHRPCQVGRSSPNIWPMGLEEMDGAFPKRSFMSPTIQINVYSVNRLESAPEIVSSKENDR